MLLRGGGNEVRLACWGGAGPDTCCVCVWVCVHRGPVGVTEGYIRRERPSNLVLVRLMWRSSSCFSSLFTEGLGVCGRRIFLVSQRTITTQQPWQVSPKTRSSHTQEPELMFPSNGIHWLICCPFMANTPNSICANDFFFPCRPAQVSNCKFKPSVSLQICTCTHTRIDLSQAAVWWSRVFRQTIFGYPLSIFFIVVNEFCERFSYYGMRGEWVQ